MGRPLKPKQATEQEAQEVFKKFYMHDIVDEYGKNKISLLNQTDYTRMNKR